MSQILPYAILSPAYVEYDPAAPAVAERVIELIEGAAPFVKAEQSAARQYRDAPAKALSTW